MFKKSLKFLALVTVTWTVSEFVTMWRMQDRRMSLKEFAKIYLAAQPAAKRDLDAALDRSISGAEGEKFTDVLFKKYPKK